MKTLMRRFSLLTAILFLAISATMAQKTYQQMTGDEQQTFVAEQSARIAKLITGGRDYAFTPEYQALIRQSVDAYARRVGNGRTDVGRGDITPVLERGSQYAPVFSNVFKANGLSPIIGIYLPMIESAYRSDLTSPSGATGMFQFIPQTAQKYGLTAEESKNSPEKEANAAARFLIELQGKFSDDPMREILALTAYNQGTKAVQESLRLAITDQNKACSICALSENKTRLNQNMQTEGLRYVPAFFAAAIVGENPESFGIKLNPLSSYTK